MAAFFTPFIALFIFIHAMGVAMNVGVLERLAFAANRKMSFKLNQTFWYSNDGVLELEKFY